MVVTHSRVAADAEAAGEAAGEAAAVAAGAEVDGDDTITLQDFIELGADIMSKSPPSLLKSKQRTTTETFEDRW